MQLDTVLTHAQKSQSVSLITQALLTEQMLRVPYYTYLIRRLTKILAKSSVLAQLLSSLLL